MFLMSINILGLGGAGCFVSSFVIAIEYSGRKFTTYLGIAFAIPFAIGELLLGLQAYYLRYWDTLQIVSMVPWIVLVPILWALVPESPRWLISMGRYKQNM